MIFRIILTIAAVLVAVYVIASILTSGGNALSETMIYLAVLGFIVGMINAKAGMIFVFLCGNYIDVLKRFLVIEGTFSMIDVIRTLAVAPVAMAAIFAGCVLRRLTQHDLSSLPWGRITLAGTVAAAVVVSALVSGAEEQNVLQSIANSALYVGLMAFGGLIYRDLNDQHRIFRRLIVFFIPVVAYGWVQLVNGYSAVEVEYAKSGLTIIDAPLLHPSATEYNRIFSTMSSSVAYTTIGTILSIYALFFGLGKGLARRLVGLLFALSCLASHIPGAGRTGWAVAIIAIFCYFVFRSRKATISIYATTSVAIILFISNAKGIGDWLYLNTQQVAQSQGEYGGRAMTMGTFTARTEGINEWLQWDYFSLFGLPEAEVKASRAHDMIGQIYVTTGIVGLMAAVSTAGLVLYYLHKNLLAMKNPSEKKMAAFYMANIFALLIGGVFSGSQLHVFPVNVYFWLMVGLLFQLIVLSKTRGAEELRLERNGSQFVPASKEVVLQS